MKKVSFIIALAVVSLGIFSTNIMNRFKRVNI